MTTIHEQRREFVNREVAIKLSGHKTTKRQKSKIFRQAWKEAKSKFK